MSQFFLFADRWQESSGSGVATPCARATRRWARPIGMDDGLWQPEKVGRNNTGKSHLLDFAEALCNKSPYQEGWQCLCEGILDEASLKQQFPPSHSGGELF